MRVCSRRARHLAGVCPASHVQGWLPFSFSDAMAAHVAPLLIPVGLLLAHGARGKRQRAAPRPSRAQPPPLARLTRCFDRKRRRSSALRLRSEGGDGDVDLLHHDDRPPRGRHTALQEC